MILLGLSWGVTSTAAIMIDGKIEACVSEERMNRIKNYDAWPFLAIEECLKLTGVSAKDIDYVVWGSREVHNPNEFLVHRYCFGIADQVKEQECYWRPRIYHKQPVEYLHIFRDKIDCDQFPGPDHLTPLVNAKDDAERRRLFHKLRAQLPFLQIGISPDKNVFMNHHACHAAFAAFAYPLPTKDKLVFTMDGSGDHENATVWRQCNGKLKKLYGTGNCILGRLYRYATLLLGMKIVEDEYKVMGLAPYSTPYHSDLPLQVYRGTLSIDGLDMEFRKRPPDSYFYFKEKFKACRFDGIAGGIQRYLEEMLTEWFANWMAHTGVTHIAFSGGVSMNVKTNLTLLEHCQPDSFHVPGSGGDESLAIGACYLFATANDKQVYPLDDYYLGHEVTRADGERLAKRWAGHDDFTIVANASAEECARFIAGGNIMGRCAGIMEFGARALGNRSILADPRKKETVRTLNRKIKSRDFWMPFAPSILHERRHEYLALHPQADYSCMTLGARTTDVGRRVLAAAIHPADDTARPQLVTQEISPEYYGLLKAFEKLTGVGALLNTSLNIHGVPIVRTAEEGLEILRTTGLDGMLIGKTLFIKNG